MPARCQVPLVWVVSFPQQFYKYTTPLITLKWICRFYMNCLLPEIASPRYTIRNDKKDIREPQYILDAIDAKKKRDEEKARQAKERANLREEKAKARQTKEQERSKQQEQRLKEREKRASEKAQQLQQSLGERQAKRRKISNE